MKFRRSEAKEFARTNMTGIWAAALMPFTDDLSINEKGFRKNLRHWVDELGIDVPLIGLAKRLEEVWLPDVEDPLILPRSSEGLYLLQRLRDEAHRFAITFHRSKRSKAMVESVLDDVPGLGEVRRKALLKKFSSVRALRRASAEEIAELPGFGPKLATQVVTALQGEQTPTGVNTATGEVIEE